MNKAKKAQNEAKKENTNNSKDTITILKEELKKYENKNEDSG